MNEDLASQLSNILEKNNIDLNQVLESFNQSQKNEESSRENDNPPNENSSSIDPEMLINSNKNSKDEQLLKSLKPYMRQSRKDKIDQYVKLLHIMKLFENFQEMGGNINDFL